MQAKICLGFLLTRGGEMMNPIWLFEHNLFKRVVVESWKNWASSPESYTYIKSLAAYFGSRLKQEWSCDYLFCWAHLWIISRSASLRGSRFGNNIFFGVSKLKRWAVYALAWSREGRKECKAGTAKGTSVECSCVELVVEWGQIIMSGLLQHIDHHLWNQSVWRWW